MPRSDGLVSAAVRSVQRARRRVTRFLWRLLRVLMVGSAALGPHRPPPPPPEPARIEASAEVTDVERDG